MEPLKTCLTLSLIVNIIAWHQPKMKKIFFWAFDKKRKFSQIRFEEKKRQQCLMEIFTKKVTFWAFKWLFYDSAKFWPFDTLATCPKLTRWGVGIHPRISHQYKSSNYFFLSKMVTELSDIPKSVTLSSHILIFLSKKSFVFVILSSSSQALDLLHPKIWQSLNSIKGKLLRCWKAS